MSVVALETLEEAIERAPELYYRLILLVGVDGPDDVGKLQGPTRGSEPLVVNVSLELSEKLLDLTQRQRALEAPKVLKELARSGQSRVTVLKNIELLFDPDLHQDPLRLLQGLARGQTIITMWPGTLDGSHLVYAEPGHPEYRRYRDPDVILVRVE